LPKEDDSLDTGNKGRQEETEDKALQSSGVFRVVGHDKASLR